MYFIEIGNYGMFNINIHILENIFGLTSEM